MRTALWLTGVQAVILLTERWAGTLQAVQCAPGNVTVWAASCTRVFMVASNRPWSCSLANFAFCLAVYIPAPNAHILLHTCTVLTHVLTMPPGRTYERRPSFVVAWLLYRSNAAVGTSTCEGRSTRSAGRALARQQAGRQAAPCLHDPLSCRQTDAGRGP